MIITATTTFAPALVYFYLRIFFSSNVSILGGTTTAVLPSGAGGGPSASLRMTLSLSLGAVQLGIPVLFASNFILYAAKICSKKNEIC